MATLAIKGHPTRGRDIIQLLEMLGGRNSNNCTGQYINRIYFINKYGYIESTDDIKLQLYCATYNLEEFEEKFPYKVGDKILYKVYGIYSKIKSMLWNKEEEQVFYRLESNKLFVATVDELNQYKEETMEITEEFYNKHCVNCGSQRCTHNGEWLKECEHYKEETMENKLEQIKIDIPKGYEFFGIDDDNKIVLAEKQPQYPKTYKECFNICFGNKHHIVQVVGLDDLGDNKDLFERFIKLKICRDTYWKIAGEQMGLGKPWKPDWCDDNKLKYCIKCSYGTPEKTLSTVNNYFLAFPTAEMRDTFYKNFKELIEQCKELL